MKGCNASQYCVRLALRFIDEEAVVMRQRHRLKRRKHVNPGPNFCWHIDGYDKLKPFGFAIHGGIDGFSRKVLWLKVGPTNNNPYVVALYFVRTVFDLSKLPCTVRADRGTENGQIARIQRSLRTGDDAFAGENSFMYERSTANQRIEAWWSILRKQCTNFWINKFKDMQSASLLDVSDPFQKEALRFSFMNLIQQDLNCTAKNWNSHFIQAKKKYGLCGGKPDKMFFLPEEHLTQSYECELNEDDLGAFENEIQHAGGDRDLVDVDFMRLVTSLIPNWEEPSSFDEGLYLYNMVMTKIREYESTL